MKIVEILQYVNSLEKQMANVTKYSEQLIKRNRDISQAMFEFGQSFTWLGQGEGDVIGEGLMHVSRNSFLPYRERISIIRTCLALHISCAV